MIIINKNKTLKSIDKSKPIGFQLIPLLAYKSSLQNEVSIQKIAHNISNFRVLRNSELRENF